MRFSFNGDMFSLYFEALKIYLIMYERRGVRFSKADFPDIASNGIYDIFYECLSNCAGYFYCEYLEDCDGDMYSFSDDAMREYYELCVQYEKLTGTAESANPHRLLAEEYVNEAMMRTNNEWELLPLTEFPQGTYLNLYMIQIYNEFEIIRAVLDSIDFFRDQIAVMQETVAALRPPVPVIGKEAA